MYEPIAIWDAESTGRQFDKVLGIGIDERGLVYATAGGGDDGVLVFDADGNVANSWGRGLVDKHGLRVIGESVWVTDRQRHVVMEFTLKGELLRTLGCDGRSGQATDEFNMPADVATALNGDIYVCDGYGNSRVMRFGADGVFKGSWGEKGSGPGQFDLVHNILIDSTGRVLIADRQNGRVQIFDADGAFLDQWTHVGKPFGLCLDRAGNVYTADGQANCVYVLTGEGEVLSKFGSTGDGPGQFQVAHSIAVDQQNRIYVAEGDGMRIQVFEAAG